MEPTTGEVAEGNSCRRMGEKVLPRVFAAPAAMQMALRVCRMALSRHAFLVPSEADCCLPPRRRQGIAAVGGWAGRARTRCVILNGGATGNASREAPPTNAERIPHGGRSRNRTPIYAMP